MAYKSLSEWKWEIVAIVCSTSLLLAVVTLLHIYDGRAIFYWHNITFNTIVSILSTSSKAALLFSVAECISQWKWVLFAHSSRPLMDLERIDCASRGPLGSIGILWPFQKISLLPIGALVTVLALALDPFAQQLVHYETKYSYSLDSNATISFAQRYSRGTIVYPQMMLPGMANVSAHPTFPMQSSILFGVVQPLQVVTQQTPFGCPTGNCTWPPFQSLAVCSSCTNLSSRLQRWNTTDLLRLALSNHFSPGARCVNGTTYQLPNGLMIINENGIQIDNVKDNLKQPSNATVFLTSFATGDASETVTFRNSDRLIWAMTILRIQKSKQNLLTWPGAPLEALECGLEFCVKQFESKVVNGDLTESDIELNLKRSPGSWQVINTPDQLEKIPSELITDSLEFDKLTSSITRTDLVLGGLYSITQPAVHGMSAFFQDVFKSKLNITMQACGDKTNSTTLTTLNGWHTDLEYEPAVMEPLYRSLDLNETFRSLAKSITNSIRSNDGETRFQTGSSASPAVHYRIEWPWITLHASLVAAALVFLLITIQKSRHPDVPAWKSSALAPLSLGSEVGGLLAGMDSVRSMESNASQHFVRLTYNEKL